jgi:hypothetical protein
MTLAIIIFHIDVKVTYQYDWHIPTTSPCQNLKHFAHFWRTPSQVRKYQRFPIVAGSILRYVQSPPALFVHLQTPYCTDISTRIWSRSFKQRLCHVLFIHLHEKMRHCQSGGIIHLFVTNIANSIPLYSGWCNTIGKLATYDVTHWYPSLDHQDTQTSSSCPVPYICAVICTTNL